MKRPLSRTSSPVSIHSEVHAYETSSPAKKPPKRQVIDDNVSHVTVEELAEGDIGYYADTEVIYPNEFEEVESSTSSDHESSDDDELPSTKTIAEKLERSLNLDEEEVEFEKKRHEKHVRRRTESRVFKRPHSLTINPDVEVIDSDALADHDLPECQRRLRRRVRGPNGRGQEPTTRGSSSEGGGPAEAAYILEGRPYAAEEYFATAQSSNDVMEVDDEM
jgi:hypothetical protein